MVRGYKHTVKYIARKKDGPFTVEQDIWRNNHWAIMDHDGCSVWYPGFNGNSKQRRQQRRKLVRDLNQWGQ